MNLRILQSYLKIAAYQQHETQFEFYVKSIFVTFNELK